MIQDDKTDDPAETAPPDARAPSQRKPSSEAKPNRGARSREKTRRRLVEAALTVMAEKGVDGCAIADITEEADVGFGSFYNHFKSKDEIAIVAFTANAEDLGRITDEIAEREHDRALAIAYIQKFLLVKASVDRVWGWFIVNAAVGLPELWHAFAKYGTRHIREGVAEGRFSVSCENTALRLILASLLATMRDMLDGSAEVDAAENTVECLLRMLGVPGEEARRLSRKKFPKYIARWLDETPFGA